MKFFHYINFILIVILLAGICVLEDVMVSNSLKEMQSICFEIEGKLENYNDLKNMNIVLSIDNLEYRWHKDEASLCYMVNHKSIQEIGQEIAKLKLYISGNDIEAFKVSLEEIKFYCHSYLHFMGANIHNVL